MQVKARCSVGVREGALRRYGGEGARSSRGRNSTVAGDRGGEGGGEAVSLRVENRKSDEP